MLFVARAKNRFWRVASRRNIAAVMTTMGGILLKLRSCFFRGGFKFIVFVAGYALYFCLRRAERNAGMPAFRPLTWPSHTMVHG
jgi:hypothetical protein